MGQFRKGKAVRWSETSNAIIAYSKKEALLHLVLLYFTAVSGVYTTLAIIADLFSGMILSIRGMIFVLAEIAVMEVVYEVLFPWLESRLKPDAERLHRFVLAAAGLMIAGVGAGLFYGRNSLLLTDGMAAIGWTYLQRINRYYNTSFGMSSGSVEGVAIALLFVIMLTIFVIQNLSFLTKRKKVWLIPSAVACIATMIIGVIPGWRCLFFLCVSFYLTGVCEEHTGRVGTPAGGERRHTQSRRSDRRIRGLEVALLLAVFGIVTIVGKGPSEKMLQKSPEVKEFQTRMEDKIKELAGDPASIVTNIANNTVTNLSRKRISNRRPGFRGKEICTITSTQRPETNLYLKDFQGGVYEDGGWNQDEKNFREACSDAGYDTFPLQQALVQAVYEGFADVQATVYQLRYEARSDMLLAPYFVDASEFSEDELSGDVLARKALFSNRSEVRGLTGNRLSEKQVSKISNRTFPDGIEEAIDWYDRYAAGAYLDVPDTMPVLGRLTGEIGNPTPRYTTEERNEERLLAAYRVSTILSRYRYSLELEDIGSGEDPVEHFLVREKAGYCVHFASAGVLLLRKMGVPARYAAGYMLSADQFKQDGQGTYTATVKDEDAHAWAEIYLEHIGWVPVEMTPGYGSEFATVTPAPEEEESTAESSAEESSGLEESEPSEESSEEPSEESSGESGELTGIQEGEATDIEEQGQASLMLWDIFKKVLKVAVKLFVGFVILLLLFQVIRHRIRAYYRVVERELKRRRYRHLIRRINRRIFRGMRRSGRFHSLHPTDAEYAKALKERYQEIPEETWDAYMQVVKQATFSKNDMTEEQAKLCYTIYQKVRLIRY